LRSVILVAQIVNDTFVFQIGHVPCRVKMSIHDL
jgi:hypothetical protein